MRPHPLVAAIVERREEEREGTHTAFRAVRCEVRPTTRIGAVNTTVTGSGLVNKLTWPSPYKPTRMGRMPGRMDFSMTELLPSTHSLPTRCNSAKPV